MHRRVVFGPYATIEIQNEGEDHSRGRGVGGTQVGCVENNVTMNKYEINSTHNPRPMGFLIYGISGPMIAGRGRGMGRNRNIHAVGAPWTRALL